MALIGIAPLGEYGADGVAATDFLSGVRVVGDSTRRPVTRVAECDRTPGEYHGLSKYRPVRPRLGGQRTVAGACVRIEYREPSRALDDSIEAE